MVVCDRAMNCTSLAFMLDFVYLIENGTYCYKILILSPTRKKEYPAFWLPCGIGCRPKKVVSG